MQDLVIVAYCDGCFIADGLKVEAETIGIPRSLVELELCPGCRERWRPFLDIIAKAGRVPDGEKGKKTVRTFLPAAARRIEPPGTSPDAAETLFREPSRAPEAQEWRRPVTPADLICVVCHEQQANRTTYGIHMNRRHPDALSQCLQCGSASMDMYSHYRRLHPEVYVPSGTWRLSREGA